MGEEGRRGKGREGRKVLGGKGGEKRGKEAKGRDGRGGEGWEDKEGEEGRVAAVPLSFSRVMMDTKEEGNETWPGMSDAFTRRQTFHPQIHTCAEAFIITST